jgi:hypothetical protein
MGYMNLTMLFNFIQVLLITRRHPTKINYFSKYILFTTIYLLQEQNLNHRKYSEQEINLSNFLQATEHDVHMYTKFGGLTYYEFL